MKALNFEWKKRLIAGLLAIAMLSGMVPSAVMAEDVSEPMAPKTVESDVEEDVLLEPEPTEESTAESTSETIVETKDETTAESIVEEEEALLVEQPMMLLSDEEPQEEAETPLLAANAAAPTEPSLNLAEAGFLDTDSPLIINTVDQLIKLSNVIPSEYSNKTITLALQVGACWDLRTTVTDETGTYQFLGLGGSEDTTAFAGKLVLPEGGTGYSILTQRALFNTLSTSAKILKDATSETSATLILGADNETDEGETPISSTNPLLADTVVGGDTDTAAWLVSLTGNGGFGGLIGTLKSGSVNLTLSGDDKLTCASGAHTGLFCNTMSAGTTLTAINNAANITVNATASGCDAGGFVGRMETGATLTASGKPIKNVMSTGGHAGGIVGSAENAVLSISGVESPDESSTVTVKASKDAGGIVGNYVNSTPDAVLDLSTYTTNVTISGGSNAGGVFGALTNRGSYTISGSDSDYAQTEQKTFRVKSVIDDTATGISTYGGLLGTYSAELLSNTLILQNISVKSQSKDKPSAYGGVIGTLPTTSYVQIDNLTGDTYNTASKFGGLVASVGETSAAMLNVGNVKLSCSYHGISGDNRGGLIGYLANGVVRLYGTTDLSTQQMTTSGPKLGQIVGYNGNGLVYAVGNGDGQYGGTDSGWKLIRYSSATASDIGNWGQVVRLDGSKLKETTDGSDNDASNLFYFNDTGHTVTVLGNPTNSFTITSVRDFAAYALAYDFISTQGSLAPVLVRIDGVDSATDQNIIVSPADSSNTIDLTGTGILGIGRDNGGTNADTVYFTGSITGTDSPTIKLDIGSSTFGTNGSSQTEAKGYGGLQVYEGAHNFLGLLSVAGSTTIRGLTIDGSVTAYGCDGKTKRMAAAVAYGKKNITFENVIVSATMTANGTNGNGQFRQAGFIGDEVNGDSDTLRFEKCTWSGSLNNTVKDSYLGGFIGYVQKNKKTITVSNCTLSGEIKADNTGWQEVHMGGLIAEFQDGDGTELKISGLSVTGANIHATTATKTCGGLLGYSWPRTNVTFGDTGSTTGVTISGCNLNANNAKFGGLVYQATGYWNATAANSIVFTKDSGEDAKANQFTGASSENNPSGLLVGNGLCTIGNDVSALYLEVGTWGAAGAAYYIADGAVTIQIDSNGTAPKFFDELVGKTINTDKSGNAVNNNAVVSLATPDHAEIDKNGCNTYKGQIANYQNGKTRYYYNLDSYREKGENGNTTVNAANLTTPAQVLSWSVSQYAASNIRGYFCAGNNAAGNNATITGPIDLTGYSYYPVSPLSTVTVGSEGSTTTLTFAYDTMNAAESVEGNSNKPFNDNTHQHYLMHHGLLYDTSSDVTVSNTTFMGTVGQLSSNGGSGALIFGTVTGNTDNPVEISLTNVTLNGLRVSNGDSGIGDYAPLLINKNENGGMKLTVDGLSTGIDYDDGASAATSLIGNIGSDTATKLTLEFKNIALDGRKSGNSTSVSNNGKHIVNYGTTKTIFTHAILLESFRYLSDSTGVYNFNSYDTKVSFGKEISDSQRNPGEQYLYYDNDDYAWDGIYTRPTSENTISSYYSSNYLPYVRQSEQDKHHELDVNLRPVHLDKGCGTYGHPYEITDGKQLVTLAKFLSTGSANNWVVRVDTDVYGAKKQSTVHTGKDGNHQYYLCEGSNWSEVTQGKDGKYSKVEDPQSSVDTADMKAYLRNAYYQITKDITISSNEYVGIGTAKTDEAFSGVIVGKAKAGGDYPTVYISSQITGAKSFGGLVCYSQGSVIKDLTVSYAGKGDIKAAGIGMTNDAVPGYVSNGVVNNPFFGGVVGYCMGGDTIIDNVSVKYGTDSVTLSGDKARLIAAGGYVGLVGGAKETRNTDKGYEKTGGGVVFRNMQGKSGLSSVNADMISATAEAKSATNENGSTYFYCNPYVGRVLDGYACYDGGKAGQSTLDNTDKNYTIPDVPSNDGGLTVTKADDGSLTATVTSEQGLWLLSAIVNSGASAMDSDGKYTEHDGSNTVDAYQYGKPRTADYDNIGAELADDTEKAAALADETCWGGALSGTSGKDKTRVSYLVKEFTNISGDVYYAAMLTGKNNSNSAVNNIVNISFSEGAIDMTNYGNGFRGIGASFGYYIKTWGMTISPLDKLYRRTLYVKSVAGAENAGTVITLNTNQHDYIGEYNASTGFNQSAGLFTMFSYTDGCTVDGLTISGNVQICMYDTSSGTLTKIEKNGVDICVGGFAGRTINANGTVTFTNFHLNGLRVYGGTSTGGVFGLTEKSGGNKTITFDQTWSITGDTQISKDVTNDGLTGGLIGWSYGGGGVTIEGYGSSTGANTSWNVDGLTVSIQATKITDSGLNAGGLIGGSNDLTNTINNVNARDIRITGKGAKDYGGLVGGMDSATTITNCKLEGVTVDPIGGKNVGGVAGRTKGLTLTNIAVTGIAVSNADIGSSDAGLGGLVGLSDGSLNITECQVTGSIAYSASEAGKIKGRVGGLIGVSKNTTTIASSTLSSVDILAKAEFVGGLIGRTDGGSATIRNITLSNVIAAKQTDKPIGLIAGEDGKIVKGYNILADSCKVGYNASATMGNLHSAALTDDGSTGLWLGKSTSSSTFVAVAVKGTNQPRKDVGSGTASIVYADYPIGQTNTTGSASPYLDVNPKIKLPLTGDNTLTLTGNGVGYTTETVTDENGNKTETNVSIPYKILSEAKTENGRYFKVTSTHAASSIDKEPTDNSTKSVRLRTFTSYLETEEKQTLEDDNPLKQSGNFPVLVVDNTGNQDVQNAIWSYIAALTNVSDGDTAKGQVADVAVTTYLWKDSAFVKTQTSTLTPTSDDNRFVCKSGAFDNGKNQFTLLDVKYKNPTTTTTNPGDYFHLYVPVLIKKVMQAKVTFERLAGTNYFSGDYSKTGYATAGFDEPVTAYITYNYERPGDEWQNALNDGSNLRWYYEKTLDLIGDGGTTLPKDTKLTLVNAQTGQVYYYQMTGGEDQRAFKLETYFKDSSGQKFDSSPICDMLGITVSGWEEDSDNKYVETNDETNATVRVGNKHYRPATTETEGLCCLTVGDVNVGEGTDKDYLKNPEGYYLTIEIPETDGISVVNNYLTVAATDPLTRTEDALPVRVSPIGNEVKHYVIYDGIKEPTITITTKQLRGTQEITSGEMQNNDAIEITLKSEISLTDAGKLQYANWAPTKLYHQFAVSLRKNDKGAVSDWLIGAENIHWTYKIDGTEVSSGNENPTDQNVLTITSDPTKDNQKLVDLLKQNPDKVTVEAVITLSYGNNVGQVFPERGEGDTQTGLFVHAESRVATDSRQLQITKLKKADDGTEKFYCKSPSYASMTYDAIDKYGTDGKTRQLGINPLDRDSVGIRAEGRYDYSAVSEETLRNAKKIRYKIELFQKKNDGYQMSSPIQNIASYLPAPKEITKDKNGNTVETAFTTKSDCYYLDRAFSRSDTGNDIIITDLVPVTGDALETEGVQGWYANYRVRLTAVLLNADGEEIPETLASDYIVYTNAKILQNLVP
ncbi:MAG: hypothetical protein MR636_04800 [Clostridiales bacterium]|nr:hypothetical protein [Clostridiales bacterium]